MIDQKAGIITLCASGVQITADTTPPTLTEGIPVGRQAPETVTILQKWVKDEIFAATACDAE